MGGARTLDTPVVNGTRKARGWGIWGARRGLTELEDDGVMLGSLSLSFALLQLSRAFSTGYMNQNSARLTDDLGRFVSPSLLHPYSTQHSWPPFAASFVWKTKGIVCWCVLRRSLRARTLALWEIKRGWLE